jgi:excisionase family DNA binding protein
MLSLSDAAKYLGMTPHGLRKLVKQGRLTYFQRGRRGRLLFKSEWIDQHIDKFTHIPRQFVPKPGQRPKQKLSIEPHAAGLGFGTNFYKR